MKPESNGSTSFQAIGLPTVAKVPQWGRLAPEVRDAVDVVGRVLPFRTNRYVLEELIDWSRVPDDSIFQLVFPQREMLSDAEYDEVRSLIRAGASEAELTATVNRIRLGLNPHPAGQFTHNVPTVNGQRSGWSASSRFAI